MTECIVVMSQIASTKNCKIHYIWEGFQCLGVIILVIHIMKMQYFFKNPFYSLKYNRKIRYIEEMICKKAFNKIVNFMISGRRRGLLVDTHTFIYEISTFGVQIPTCHITFILRVSQNLTKYHKTLLFFI
jgi:hypothetical protein